MSNSFYCNPIWCVRFHLAKPERSYHIDNFSENKNSTKNRQGWKQDDVMFPLAHYFHPGGYLESSGGGFIFLKVLFIILIDNDHQLTGMLIRLFICCEWESYWELHVLSTSQPRLPTSYWLVSWVCMHFIHDTGLENFSGSLCSRLNCSLSTSQGPNPKSQKKS